MKKNIDLKARIRNRRWQRGVAMVEAGVVFPVMASFLFVMSLAHHMYDLKLETIHRARERSWSYALEGCTGERDDDSYKRVYFTIDGSSATKDSGTTVGSATQHSATVSGTGTAHLGGRNTSQRASSTTTVYCNPKLGPKLKLQTIIDKIF
jgi:hypothetical protein